MTTQPDTKVKRLNITVKPEIDELIRKIAREKNWKIAMVIEQGILLIK